MEHTLKPRQQGFLLVLAVILILIMGFIGMIFTRLFINQTQTSTNILFSKQAQYIALSGLEIAKRDLTKKTISCANLAAQHTAETLANGQFSVTGTLTTASTTLAANITTSSSSIDLVNATGFAPKGIIKINSEEIYYASLSDNTLSSLSRAKGGTTASSHTAGATITQNQCAITSTGAIPTINAPTYKNTVSSVILISGEMSFGGYQPSVSSSGNVSMSGNAYISNPGIAINDSDYAGSTVGIMSSYSLNLSGNAHTMVENAGGTGMVTSSTRGHILADVIQNLPASPSLYESYFGDYTPAQLQSTATTQGNYYSSLPDITSINGVMGEVIYVNGNIDTTGNPNETIGSPTSPVVLYVDGSFNSTGTLNLTIYGIIYVTGTINMSGNTSINGQGSLATAGGLSMSGSTNIALRLESDDPVMSTLYSSIVPGAGATAYTTQKNGNSTSLLTEPRPLGSGTVRLEQLD